MTYRRWILSSTPINAPDYIPPPHYSSPGHRRLVNAFLAAVSVTVFLSFLLLTYYIIFIRRRNHLPSVNPSPPAPSNEDYHVTWLVRTVGLNDTSINSIPLKPYISGIHSGAADCTVCLVEFRDRDLVRYLPGCDHAFHVNCIDTWLRSHVSCPLCRTNIDPSEGVAVQIDDLIIINERSGSLDLREEGRREIEADVSPDCGESCSSSFAESGLMPELRSKSMDSLR